jgi:diguanylate cyclase (GGDEF)-like protein
MTKREASPAEPAAAGPRSPRKPLRRVADGDLPAAARVSGGSDLRRLADEVARLEAELAGMREKLRELEARADIDPLTDVFNRRGFERELKRAIAHVARYGGSAALVYLDLDGFKAINDRHGHAAGDAVLKAVAAALVQRVRASDTVARLGGDEFALLLWNLDARNAGTKAEALETAIDALGVPFGAEQLTVGVSAGVAMLDAGTEAAEAVVRADAAMYARKGARKAGG